MEGDGGMVAVVEGLRDKGLAVTLLSRRPRPCHDPVLTGHSAAPAVKPASQACQTAVDTATETGTADRASTSVYRSTYQMAHCRPAQFAPVYYNQYSMQGFQQYRPGSPPRSADEEAFVESLRKYPASPGRSLSADLIQRMLNYTQYKNGSRYSNTRSAKSLPSKEALKKLHFDEIPTRDTGTTNDELKPNFGYKRDVELIPVPTSSRKSRCDNQIGMFDYLKSHHRDKKLKGTEVRYLTNVKQCIRDRLRQLCDEDTTPTRVCSTIQSRYSQHRRRYHKADTSQKCTPCSRCGSQDASQNEIQGSPSTSKERKDSNGDKALSSFKHSKACFCDRPGSCDCGKKTSPNISKPTVPPEYLVSEHKINKHCISICEHECNENEDDYIRQLKENVFDWLQELPVYANFSTKDAIRRKEMIDQLIENLKNFKKDNSNLDKLEFEIKKCLKVLPMWRPESKTDQESFENLLAQNLINRIKNLLFDREEVKDCISKWIDSVPLSDHMYDKEKIINELAAKIQPITANRPLSDKDYKEALRSEIISTLNQLPLSLNDSQTMDINKIADKLVDKLVLLPNTQIESHQLDLPQEHLGSVVQKWFDDISSSLGVDFIDNRKDLEMLATKLQTLLNIENYEHRQNSMRQEIIKWLQNLQQRRGRNVDTGTQENFVNKLMSMINDNSKVQKKDVESDLMAQKIWEWLESQIEFQQNNTLQLRDVVVDLSRKLQNIKDRTGDLTDRDVHEELTNWFEKLSRERGIEIHPDNRKKLEEKLLSLMSPIKKRRHWEKPNAVGEQISKAVSQIINDTLLPLTENDKEELKDRIVQVITQNWNAIKSIQTDELLSKINSILKNETILPEAQLTELSHKITAVIKDVLPNSVEKTENTPLELDKTARNQLQNKIESILESLPLKDKKLIIDTVTDILVRDYKDDKTDDTFETILELIKKGNVSESDAQKIASNLMNMWYQFKNEHRDTTFKSPSYGSGESLWIHKQMFMQRLEREITDFMDKVLNESSSFYKDKSSEDSIKYNKFKIHPFTASSPLDSNHNVNNEKKYQNQIKEIIKKWIGSLEIDDYVDETFKDNMATDIATDIIDRYRYLQISKTKRSSQDELEHLKYQLFKWTSKLPNQTNLTAKTSKLKMLIKSLEALGIPNLIQETNEQPISNVRNSLEDLEENIYDAIKTWLNDNLPLKPRNSQDRQMMDHLIRELSKKLKELWSSNLEARLSNVQDLRKDEIVNFLRKLYLEQKSYEEFHNIASELMEYLKGLDLFSDIFNSPERNQEAAKQLRKKEAIKRAIQNWCQTLPLKEGKTYADIKDIIDNLSEAVSRYLLITDMEHVNTFMDEILNNLKRLPLQFDAENTKKLPEFTERLIETLKEVLNDTETYFNSTDNSSIRKPPLKKAADIMYDNIQSWCENLPLDLGVTNEGSEQVNVIKQNLAAKLLKKVGEINLDPEIFNDDDLYEDILKDEIEKVLEVLPKTKQLEEALPTLKENLVKYLLEAKEGMKNEMAGFAYKQQLRDAISKTLSSIGFSIKEQTSFEVLKDNLADAFISLHYVGDDEELKRKFKDKIFNEVNKFCDAYLEQNPSSPLNAQQLNQELYNALKKVPVPKEESMRREVEQIRMKDLVNDWFKDLPLEDSLPSVKKNKIISILAKRLYEIENEAEINPDINLDETMNNEISKWLKKFKLKSVNESDTDAAAKTLISKLKATKPSRKLDESTMRKSINYADLSSELYGTSHYPPSRLSAEDRAHLQRIKERMSVDRTSFKSDDRKDASVSPVPITTGIQTEEKQSPDYYIFQKVSQNASIQTINQQPEPPTQITPQVIVKEYYWDSHGSPTMHGSGSILSYVQPPVAHVAENKQQQAKVAPQDTSHVTSSSQTVPVPASKATITLETSAQQVIKTKIQNNGNVTTSTKNSSLPTATPQNELNIDLQQSHYNPDDYLQLNSRKKGEIKPCQPCRGRAVLSGDLDASEEPTTSNARQENNKVTSSERHGLESRSRKNMGDDNNYWDEQPCFRRPIYQSPTRESECHIKRRRKSQQHCSCKNPAMMKCTIRPQPCHSNKSCYVSKKHCPKCWDGFCPHPSFLYFKPD